MTNFSFLLRSDIEQVYSNCTRIVSDCLKCPFRGLSVCAGLVMLLHDNLDLITSLGDKRVEHFFGKSFK